MATLAVILFAVILLATPVRHFREIPERFRDLARRAVIPPVRPGLPRRRRRAGLGSSRRARPARRCGRAPRPPQLADSILWTRTVEPREQYLITYVDKDGDVSERLITLQKIGAYRGDRYYGVLNDGRFKTMRADRVLFRRASALWYPRRPQCAEPSLPSIRPLPTYRTELPPWPLPAAIYTACPTAAARAPGASTLNAYTCTCPEKRIRTALGYKPGELGMICPHLARAILEHQLALPQPFPPDILDFLATPHQSSHRKPHVSQARTAC